MFKSFTCQLLGVAKCTGCAALLAYSITQQVFAQALVETHHNDVLRTGWNQAETALTVASVSGGTFALQHSVALDAEVDAQPLYVSDQTLPGQTTPHDIVYVATEANTIYGIDASTGAVLLKRNLGQPVPWSSLPGQCRNNGPTVGINSTPVISKQSNTMWVVTYVFEFRVTGNSERPFTINWYPEYILHALDLGTLADKVPPVVIAATARLSDGSFYRFNPSVSRQRSALLLANFSIYIGFASFCDASNDLSRGWLLRWNANTLTPYAGNELTDKDPASPHNDYLTSIWMSGSGPATEMPHVNLVNWSHPVLETPIYFVTGNSDWLGGHTHLSESLVKIAPGLSAVLDYFTPYDATDLDYHDQDFGSGGIMLLPDGRGPTPHVAVAAGKDGNMFLINRDDLGKYKPGGPGGPDGLPFLGFNRVLGTYSIGSCFCGPSYFEGADSFGRVVSSGGGNVIVWRVEVVWRNDVGQAELIKESQSPDLQTGGDGGFFTSVSSNGTQADSAIIWAISRPTERKFSNILLYAFDASSSKIIASSVAGIWPNSDSNSNTVPTVANGRVYVASYKELAIFGLGSPASPAVLTQVEADRAKAVTAFNEDMPDVVSGEHVIYGTVREINGSTVILERRDLTMVKVNIADVTINKQIAMSVVGRAVQMRGHYDDRGTLVAAAVMHAKPQPALWREDQ
jgi:PQQ enzyme repeat